MLKRFRRLAVVLVLSLATLLGTTSLAGAAPAPTLTPKQQQALCIARKSVELLKALDRQAWRDPRAKAAAIKAIPAKAKELCPLPGGGGTTPTVPAARLPQLGVVSPAGPGEISFSFDVSAPAFTLTNPNEGSPCVVGGNDYLRVGTPSAPPAGVTAHGAFGGQQGVDVVRWQVRNTTASPVTVTILVVCEALPT